MPQRLFADAELAADLAHRRAAFSLAPRQRDLPVGNLLVFMGSVLPSGLAERLGTAA